MKKFKDLDINGPDEQLLALVQAVSANLPAGWRRDPEAESRMDSLDPAGRDAWFAFTRDAKEGYPRVGLSLAHERGRLHVPNIVSLDAGDLSIDQYNRVLNEFEDMLRVCLPPNSELDVRVTSDEAAITDWVSSDAADLLEHFSNLANMSTGAGHPLDFQRWARFLVQAHKEGAALHSSFLSRWLIEELRWPPDQADNLARDYQFARDLLKVYDEST